MIIAPKQAFGNVSSKGDKNSKTDAIIPLAIIVTNLSLSFLS